MPRKKGTSYATVSSGYVHPSLQKQPEYPAGTDSLSVPISVNERISHLRRTQAPKISRDDPGDTVSYYVKLGGMSQTRAPAGPEPRSWSKSRQYVVPTLEKSRSELAPGVAQRIDHLPGISPPNPRSLLHMVLKMYATNFESQCYYDHVYLSTLPVELKSLLLSYLATYGSHQCLSMANLKLLFDLDSTEDSTPSDTLERLDLGGRLELESTQRPSSLTLKQLSRYWKAPAKYVQSIPENWLEESPRAPPRLRFPALTKLSLARPPSSISWSDLISFSQHLGAITHLSLAYWPTPRLPAFPTDTLPSTFRNHRDNLSSSSSSPNPSIDGASVILKQFSRNTPSLTWLSLEGCGAWFHALLPRLDPAASSRPEPSDRSGLTHPHMPLSAATTSAPPTIGPEWTQAWRRIALVVLAQSASGLPPAIDPAVVAAIHAGANPTASSASSATSRAAHERRRNERYVVVAPNVEVAALVEARGEARRWLEREVAGVRVAAEVRRVRREAGQGWCGFDFGMREGGG